MSVDADLRTSEHAGDSYDLAVSLRQRLADAGRTPSASVTSQLQTVARERLDRGGRARSRSFRRGARA
jgi:hypothetical protein